MNTADPEASARPENRPVGTVRYWAAAREAAGTAEEPYHAATLAEALDAAIERHGGELARVLARCAFVVDGTPASRRRPDEVELSDGGTVEVLPPFAGGASGTIPGCPPSLRRSLRPR